MIWLKRIVIASPFAIAAVLTVLVSVADRLRWHREHIDGYGFLFATPWAWLLDHDWFGSIHTRSLETLISHAIILWVPALLYSGCLWLLLRALAVGADRPSR
jgi:hypothetical protein